MKRYVIIAGVNGAGKSTLYQTNRLIEDMERVNLDEIVRSFGSWKKPEDVMEAGRLAVEKINACFDAGVSFNQETTLCGKSIIRNIMRAKELGYFLELYYIGLDSPETAKERVRIRVSEGGHGIPEEDIERRYYESLRQLKTVIPLCDKVKVYDNTKVFVRIAEFIAGRCCMRAEDLPEWYLSLGI